MKSKKILIISIIIILILVLAVAGTVFGYLYMKTDTFKSDKELFAKYASQNIETINEFADSQIVKEYKNLNQQNLYESNTKIKTTYSEGGEVSNLINNLSMELNVQKDNSEKYFYADGQILADNQKYLESEIIKDNECYGVRFTDVVKQFITVKDDQNLDSVANDMGTDSATLQKIMNLIDGTSNNDEKIISAEDVAKIKEKYSKLITDTISNGTFTSNKKAQITYNNNTVMTKAYTVTLTSEQVENLLIQILNNIETEEIILNNIDEKDHYKEFIEKEIKSLTDEKEVPGVKITVYEQKQETIRTVIDIAGTSKIVIENTNSNGELKTNIQVSAVNSEQTDEYDIEISKNNSNQEENMNFYVNVTNGDDKYEVSFLNNAKFTDVDIELNSSINYKKDIVTASIVLENSTTIGKVFDKKQTLSDENNFVLNDAEEATRKNIIEQLKVRVPEKVSNRISLLKEALGLTSSNEDEIVPESSMTQIDINKFNAKFEFYTGDEVSPDNIKALINIAKDNLGSYEIKEINDDSTTTSQEKVKYSMTLKIERNKNDENGANQLLEKIDDKKKYKVSIFYKDQNKLIDYITIDEVDK